jgi:hypothetical protein
LFLREQEREKKANRSFLFFRIGNTPILNENGCWNLSTNSVKSEPVCVFVNRNYDENSSDSEHLQEQPLTIDEEPTKTNTKNSVPA